MFISRYATCIYKYINKYYFVFGICEESISLWFNSFFFSSSSSFFQPFQTHYCFVCISFMCVLLFNTSLFLFSPYLFSLLLVIQLRLIGCKCLIICFIYNNVFIYYCTVFGYSRSNNVVFLLLLLCYTLTPWMLFLFFLCPEVFATSVSIITYKVFVINILYIYTFNYLYLKQSFLPYFVVVSYCFLNPVWFAFKLFTSSLPPLHCC